MKNASKATPDDVWYSFTTLLVLTVDQLGLADTAHQGRRITMPAPIQVFQCQILQSGRLLRAQSWQPTE